MGASKAWRDRQKRGKRERERERGKDKSKSCTLSANVVFDVILIQRDTRFSCMYPKAYFIPRTDDRRDWNRTHRPFSGTAWPPLKKTCLLDQELKLSLYKLLPVFRKKNHATSVVWTIIFSFLLSFSLFVTTRHKQADKGWGLSICLYKQLKASPAGDTHTGQTVSVPIL